MTDSNGQANSGIGAANTSSGWLISHGRQPWTAVRELLAGCTCVWMDLDGLHDAPAPADPPLATHLWAWDMDKLLRVRIDGSEGITGELRLTEPDQGEPVTVIEQETTSWPTREGRVSVEQEWRGRALHLYQVEDLMPVEFVRLQEP